MTVIGKKIDFFAELYQTCKNRQGEMFEQFDVNMAQYRGSHDIDGSHEKASAVWNITYELVESQVSTQIPAPRVDPERLTEKSSRNARVIERLLEQTRNKLPFEQYNDLDERRTYIYGGAAMLVEWDETIKTHDTVGGIRVTPVSPTDIMPQPDCFDYRDMEYIFLRQNTSKDEVARRYGVERAVLDDADRDESVVDQDESETITIYMCFYRNGNGDICRYVWTGDVELLDEEDYYARFRRECRKCGRREGLCECEKPDFFDVPNEYEEIFSDIPLQHTVTLPTGEVIREKIPAMIPERREDGSIVTEMVKVPQVDEEGNVIPDPNSKIGAPLTVEQEMPKMVKNRVKYYKPHSFPLIIRRNISDSESFWGQSDVKTIREQQQIVNKYASRILVCFPGGD